MTEALKKEQRFSILGGPYTVAPRPCQACNLTEESTVQSFRMPAEKDFGIDCRTSLGVNIEPVAKTPGIYWLLP